MEEKWALDRADDLECALWMAGYSNPPPDRIESLEDKILSGSTAPACVPFKADLDMLLLPSCSGGVGPRGEICCVRETFGSH